MNTLDNCSVTTSLFSRTQPSKRLSYQNEYDEYNNKIGLGYQNNKFIMQIDMFSKLSIVQGNVQSGKFENAFALAMRAIFDYGTHVIYIINNYSSDMKQVKNRVNTLINNVYGLNCSNKPDFDDYIVDVGKTSQSCLKKLFKDQENRYVFVSLGNKLSVSKLIKAYHNNNVPLYTIIDESDQLCTSTGIMDSERSILIKRIFELSNGCCRFTATPIAHISLNETYIDNITCNDIYYAPISKDYVSYGHSKFKIKELKMDMYMSTVNVDYNELQKQYLYFIINNRLSKWEQTKISETNPCVGLINISSIKENHRSIEQVIKKRFVATFIRAYNGKYEVIYPDKTFLSDKERNRRTSFSLQEHLKTLHDEKKNKTYDHRLILIIGCNQIIRGIAIRSEIVGYCDLNHIIYAFFCIIDLSEKRPSDNLIQSVLRIGGIFKNQTDDFKGVTVYTSKSIKNNLKQIMKWNENIKKEIKKHKETGTNEKIINILPKFKYKPNRDISSKNTKIYKDYDIGGYFASQESLDRNKTNCTPNKKEKNNVMFIKNNFFVRWSQPECNSKISMLMKSIDPEKTYSKLEFQELVKSIGFISISSVIHQLNRQRKSKGYGLIFDINKDKSKFKLKNNLVGVYKDCFNYH